MKTHLVSDPPIPEYWPACGKYHHRTLAVTRFPMLVTCRACRRTGAFRRAMSAQATRVRDYLQIINKGG